MIACSVPGCESAFKIKQGYCNKHYLRFLRYGDPLGGGTYRGDTLKFLDDHADFKGDDCLIWPFSRDAAGYARIRKDGKNVPAHRVMCEMVHGAPSAPSMQSTHKCGRGQDGCVNPNHLEWGTGFKNQQDRVEHGTSNRGERCASHKLTEDEVLVIFARLGAGDRPADMSREYGVHPVTILDIKSGRTWAWLTGLKNPKERDKFGNLIAANDNAVSVRGVA